MLALLSQLPTIGPVWDPCDDGGGHLVAALQRAGITAVGSGPDFLSMTAPPVSDVTDIITNPPLGPARRRELAIAFIRHALTLGVRQVAMLLPIDFNSAITRQDVFRFCPAYTGKLILLNRIRWIPGSTGSPSSNHCWMTWDHTNLSPPVLRYASKYDTCARPFPCPGPRGAGSPSSIVNVHVAMHARRSRRRSINPSKSEFAGRASVRLRPESTQFVGESRPTPF